MEQTKDLFGKRLFELRESRGESQQELADSIGITRQSLSRYELGERTANIDLLKKISEHYNISADYLLGLTDNATVDTNLQAVCEYTGLSDKAILTIKDYVYNLTASGAFTPEDKADELFYYVLNTVLCSLDFYDVLHYFGNMQIYSKQYFLATLKENFFDYINDKYDTFFTSSNWYQTTELDVDRYKISREIEKLSDIFDGRLKINHLNNKELLHYSGLTKQEFQEIIETNIQTAIQEAEKDEDLANLRNIKAMKLLSSSDEISKLINEILEVPENFKLFMENERIRCTNEWEVEENGEHNPPKE